jgi:hypothetical protein
MFTVNRPKLAFKEKFDERLAFEVSQKGWCGIAVVELPEGGRVDVFFYSPTRLAQDLETDMKAGHHYIAEPGLIVVPEVTLPYMEAAVEQLYRQGYFEHFVHSKTVDGTEAE